MGNIQSRRSTQSKRYNLHHDLAATVGRIASLQDKLNKMDQDLRDSAAHFQYDPQLNLAIQQRDKISNTKQCLNIIIKKLESDGLRYNKQKVNSELRRLEAVVRGYQANSDNLIDGVRALNANELQKFKDESNKIKYGLQTFHQELRSLEEQLMAPGFFMSFFMKANSQPQLAKLRDQLNELQSQFDTKTNNLPKVLRKEDLNNLLQFKNEVGKLYQFIKEYKKFEKQMVNNLLYTYDIEQYLNNQRSQFVEEDTKAFNLQAIGSQDKQVYNVSKQDKLKQVIYLQQLNLIKGLVNKTINTFNAYDQTDSVVLRLKHDLLNLKSKIKQDKRSYNAVFHQDQELLAQHNRQAKQLQSEADKWVSERYFNHSQSKQTSSIGRYELNLYQLSKQQDNEDILISEEGAYSNSPSCK